MVYAGGTLPPGLRVLLGGAPEPRSASGLQPPGLVRAPPGRGPSPPPVELRRGAFPPSGSWRLACIALRQG
eukprot:2548038-Alexandrium_andersonii.AAC.1